MKYFLLLTFIFVICFTGLAQSDSLSVVNDSLIGKDSVLTDLKDSAKTTVDTTSYSKFLVNPFIGEMKPLQLLIKERSRHSKDDLFYLATGLLLFLAFNRLVFSKYFINLFRLFFQPTFRQKQTREQLLQNNLPSLLYNLLFIFSGAAYIALISDYYSVAKIHFWLLFLYSAALLTILYSVKFLFLRFSGWLFHAKEATTTYIFIVYLINKISGIILIPFIIVIAFSEQPIISIAVVSSLLILGLLFSYRYLISYGPVHKEIKVSPVHFFFYICAFELVPLLVIYKVLMIYMSRSL